MSLLFVTDERFLGHRAGSAHPEQPARLTAVWEGLEAAGLDDALVRVPPRLAEPDELLDVAMDHARRLAARPIASLVASKRLLNAPLADGIADARRREDRTFASLLGGPANAEALRAFAEKRSPDFTGM